jgi:hypothetical protein
MAAMCSIHQPDLYLMKCLSMSAPEDVSEGVYGGYAQKVDYPPAGPEKTYLL